MRSELWSWGHGSRQPACVMVGVVLRQVAAASSLQDSDLSLAGSQVSVPILRDWALPTVFRHLPGAASKPRLTGAPLWPGHHEVLLRDQF